MAFFFDPHPSCYGNEDKSLQLHSTFSCENLKVTVDLQELIFSKILFKIQNYMYYLIYIFLKRLF